MINFKPVESEDKTKIEEYLAYTDSRSCDLTFATIYLWRFLYHTSYAICDDCIIFYTRLGETESFSFPIGKKDPEKAICALLAHCEEKGMPCLIHSITKKEEKWLTRRFPGQFAIEYDRDLSDYIYETEALIHLRGKKYHGKRNHVNKFIKTYDWAYERIGQDQLPECLAMLEEWRESNPEKEDPGILEEVRVSRTALLEREFLGLSGGLIRADGRLAAFSLGEQISPDTFCVHIEKALTDVSGAYAMINQQFLIHEAAGTQYVNREDDVGDPGLRKSKLSYHPAFLLEKGIARYRG